MNKIALSLTLFTVFLISLSPITSDDLFMCLALGRKLWTLGSFGDTDPYLFTIPDYHWHVWHEWLAYLIYYGLNSFSGMAGVIALRALLVVAAVATIWRAGRATAPALKIGVSALALAAALPRIGDRASLFSDVFTCVVLSVVLTPMPNLKLWRWLMPLLFLVWVQLHPGFPIGLIFLAAMLLGRWHSWTVAERHSWAVTVALCVAVGIINPIGWSGLIYPWQKILSPEWDIFRQINSEWQSTLTVSFLPLIYKLYLIILMTMAALASTVQLRRQPKQWLPLLATLVLCYLALSAVRFLALAGFGLGVILITQLAEMNLRRLSNRTVTALACAALALTLLVGLGLPDRSVQLFWRGGLVSAAIPVSAAQWLELQPPGNVFNEYDLGGLLAWQLDGRMKIAAHGHIDSPSLVASHILRFSNTREDFEEVVIKGDVKYFFVHQSTMAEMPNAGFVQELRGPRWSKVFADPQVAIFQFRK